MDFEKIPPIVYILLGLCCVGLAGGLSAIGIYFTILNSTRKKLTRPIAQVHHAVLHRIATPKPVVHTTVHHAPESEAVALKRWQTIQIWTVLGSIVALIVGAVLFNIGDVAVLIIVAIANFVVAYLKSEATRRFGGGTDITKQ